MAFDWNTGQPAKKKSGFDFNSGNDVRAHILEHVQTEPAKPKGFFSQVGNIGKSVFNAFTSSEQTLGKGLSTVFDSNTQQTVSDVNKKDQTGQQNLINGIHQESDPIKKQHLVETLKKLYGADYQSPTAEEINPGFGLSNKQVVGAALGTGLDVLSAGSYGKGASLAENTGKLVTKSEIAANLAEKVGLNAVKITNPIAEQIAKKTLTETLTGIGKKTAVRAVEGAGMGYGYDVSQNLQNNKENPYKPGTGFYIGGTIPIALGAFEATKAITKSFAPRIVNSLVKPKVADFSYGKNPGRAVTEMGITGNNLQDFGEKIGNARQEVGRKIGTIYSAPENATKIVNLEPDIQKIDQAMADAAKGGKNNQNIVTTLQNLKDALLYDHKVNADGSIVRVGDIPANLSNVDLKKAFDLKQKVAEATQFTGRPSDDKTVNSVLKNIYGGIKDKLNKTVGNPELTKLNEQYADLTSAEIAVKNRDKIVQRANLVSLPGAVEGLGAAITAALATGGAAIPTILAGASGLALDKALSSTAVKTRVAAWLGSATPSMLDKLPSEVKTTLIRLFPKFVSKLGK